MTTVVAVAVVVIVALIFVAMVMAGAGMLFMAFIVAPVAIIIRFIKGPPV